jgi:hypothetical protein
MVRGHVLGHRCVKAAGGATSVARDHTILMKNLHQLWFDADLDQLLQPTISDQI